MISVKLNVGETPPVDLSVGGDENVGLNISTPTEIVPYTWMGKNPHYLGEIYSLDTTLDHTDYNGWTPSTTAKTIVASVNVAPTVVMDLEHYDYVVVWVCDSEVAYNSSWSASKGSPIRYVGAYNQAVFRRPANKADADSGTFNYNVSQYNTYYVYWLYYWSSTTAKTLSYYNYAPCYISGVTGFGFSSTSSLTPTVTIKTPVLSARCSTTYFTTGNAAKVDQANTTVKLKGYLYRVDMGTCAAVQNWQVLDDIWQNPL